jgi:hypothetical protein
VLSSKDGNILGYDADRFEGSFEKERHRFWMDKLNYAIF